MLHGLEQFRCLLRLSSFCTSGDQQVLSIAYMASSQPSTCTRIPPAPARTLPPFAQALISELQVLMSGSCFATSHAHEIIQGLRHPHTKQCSGQIKLASSDSDEAFQKPRKLHEKQIHQRGMQRFTCLMWPRYRDTVQRGITEAFGYDCEVMRAAAKMPEECKARFGL